MGSMKKWMLAAALAAGIVGMGAAPAQAARIGVYIGARGYVPACPGPGYAWVGGYWADGSGCPDIGISWALARAFVAAS